MVHQPTRLYNPADPTELNMDRRTFLSHSSQLFVVTGLAPNMFSENRMLESNQRRSLSFSNDWIESVLVGAVHEMPVATLH